jgi:hypothetical protein
LVAAISGFLCLVSVALAIHACFYCEVLTWWGKISPDGWQDKLTFRPWVGQGQIWYTRFRFAPADEHYYIPIVHGYPPRTGPLSGFEYRAPMRWQPVTVHAFLKQHHLFGLFAFEGEGINFDLAKDIGRPHIYERGWHIGFPLWVPVILFAVLPAVVLLRRRRERRRLIGGYCSVCGYDLRATLGRCPECGATTPAASIEPG